MIRREKKNSVLLVSFSFSDYFLKMSINKTSDLENPNPSDPLDVLINKPYANKLEFDALTAIEIDDQSIEQKELLGKGQFEVWKCVHIEKQNEMAMKILDLRVPKRQNAFKKLQKSKEKMKQIRKFSKEIEVLRKLRNHQYIVKFYGFSYQRDHIRIFMELLPYSLDELIKLFKLNFDNSSKDYDNSDKEKNALLYVTAVSCLNGLAFMHSKKVVHGDIKPANILLNHSFRPKICDFSEAVELGEASASGTFLYMSPNRYTKNERPSFGDDLWSLVISILEARLEENPIFYLSQCQDDDLNWNLVDYIKNLSLNDLINLIKQSFVSDVAELFAFIITNYKEEKINIENLLDHVICTSEYINAEKILKNQFSESFFKQLNGGDSKNVQV